MGKADEILTEMEWVPAPFLSNQEMDNVFKIARDPETLKNVEKVCVDPESLQPTQLKMDPNQVDKFAKLKNFDGALVLRRNNRNWIVDGHHRTAAAIKAKEPMITVHMLNPGNNKEVGGL